MIPTIYLYISFFPLFQHVQRPAHNYNVPPCIWIAANAKSSNDAICGGVDSFVLSCFSLAGCLFLCVRWFACVEKAHWTRQTNITYGFIRWCYKTLLFLFVIIVFILKNAKHTTAFLTVIDEENQRIQKPSSCYSFPLMKHLLRDGEKHCDFYPRANNSQQCVSYAYLSIHTLICSRLCVLCPPPMHTERCRGKARGRRWNWSKRSLDGCQICAKDKLPPEIARVRCTDMMVHINTYKI